MCLFCHFVFGARQALDEKLFQISANHLLEDPNSYIIIFIEYFILIGSRAID